MAHTIYKLFDTSAASVDAAASIDIQDDGVIEGLAFSMMGRVADAQDDGGRFEVSFASTNGFSSNDTRASIFGAGSSQAFLTSGGGPVAINGYVPMEVAVQGGERIYLHHQNTGSITVETSVWLYVRAKGGGVPRRQNFRS